MPVTIRGKQYTTVAERVRDFRAEHTIEDGWAITTEILEWGGPEDGSACVVAARVVDPTGRTVGSGLALECVSTSQRSVNYTSHLENSETSAIGRALASAGYGGDGEYCTANEVEEAKAASKRKSQRKTTKRQADHDSEWERDQAWFCATVKEITGVGYEPIANFAEAVGRPRPSQMSADQRRKLVDFLGTEDGKARFSAFFYADD